jgi:hypothetical protein
MERRFGGLAIENLTLFIVGGMAIVFALMLVRPEFISLLTFSVPAIAHGQVWRLVTFLFIPTTSSPFWLLVALYFLWLLGTNLESEWGAFKYNAYYFIGMAGTAAAAFLTGASQGNNYLNLSLLFAFATLYPDYQILIFFVIPLRVKWLGWLSFALVAYEFVISGWSERAAIVAALANYLLFFWREIAALARGGKAPVPRGARRESSRPPSAPAATRVCALCGAREEDGADVRVCSCEKCKAATGGASRALCLEHARNH